METIKAPLGERTGKSRESSQQASHRIIIGMCQDFDTATAIVVLRSRAHMYIMLDAQDTGMHRVTGKKERQSLISST